MDIVEQPKPDILARLDDFDASNYASKYDLVSAFQMLEHSPYELFRAKLSKMAMMSKNFVFISLPYSCFGFRLSLSLAFGQNSNKRKEFCMYFPMNKANRRYRDEFKDEFPWAVHYWEIGRRGYSMKRIKKDIRSAGLQVVDSYHAKNPFHYFILTRKVDSVGSDAA